MQAPHPVEIAREFGELLGAREERRRIRALQRQALRELRAYLAIVPPCSESGVPHETFSCTGECVINDAIRAIDRATRAPRKAREKYRGAGITSVTVDEAAKWTPEQVRAFNSLRVDQSASPANVGAACDHGVTYDSERAAKMRTAEIRRVFPRLCGECPKGCGFNGIAYASTEHFVMGDW